MNLTNSNWTIHWTFAQKHPVLTFLLINFSWTWLFWLAAIPFRGQNNLLVTSMVILGGYGPAIGGILALGLKNGLKFTLTWKKVLIWASASALIFALMALRYAAGNIQDYDILAPDLTLTTPILLIVLLACLVGGWVFSSVVSSNPEIRTRMSSLLPWRLSLRWALFSLLFFPGMVLLSWGTAAVLGMDVEYPGLWGHSFLEVLPLYLLSFCLTALAQGGNEEPGWRGIMQPALQKRFNPLTAALIVSVFWSLWHLPLYLNGFYPGDLVGGMIGGGIYRILLAIFLAWLYSRSAGNLFLMVFLHTSFNVLVNFLPASDLILLVLWLIVVVLIIFKDKMYLKQTVSER